MDQDDPSALTALIKPPPSVSEITAFVIVLLNVPPRVYVFAETLLEVTRGMSTVMSDPGILKLFNETLISMLPSEFILALGLFNTSVLKLPKVNTLLNLLPGFGLTTKVKLSPIALPKTFSTVWPSGIIILPPSLLLTVTVTLCFLLCFNAAKYLFSFALNETSPPVSWSVVKSVAIQPVSPS